MSDAFLFNGQYRVAYGVISFIWQVADGTRHLPHLWDLCSNEIVVRSAKHILKVTHLFQLFCTSLLLDLEQTLETTVEKL